LKWLLRVNSSTLYSWRMKENRRRKLPEKSESECESESEETYVVAFLQTGPGEVQTLLVLRLLLLFDACRVVSCAL
jgi:hypothetical protein